MKRLAVLALLIFLISCTQDVIQSPDNILANDSKQDAEQVEPQSKETSTNNPIELSSNYYKFFLGNELDFDGNSIKLLDVNNEAETTLDINNKQWVMYETDTDEVVGNIKLRVEELNYNFINKTKIYAVITIENFKLDPNEYLIHDKESINTLNGVKTTLKRVNFDRSIIIDFGKELSIKIPEGSKSETQGATIANVRAFPRPVTSESYAIIKIE